MNDGSAPARRVDVRRRASGPAVVPARQRGAHPRHARERGRASDVLRARTLGRVAARDGQADRRRGTSGRTPLALPRADAAPARRRACEATSSTRRRSIQAATGTDPRPWFRCPFGAGADDGRVLGVLETLGYRNVHWHVELEDWEALRTGPMIAHDAIEGVRAHGDGAVVLLHTWPGGTGEGIGPMIAGLAGHRCVVRVDRRAGRSAVTQAARDPRRRRRRFQDRRRLAAAGRDAPRRGARAQPRDRRSNLAHAAARSKSAISSRSAWRSRRRRARQGSTPTASRRRPRRLLSGRRRPPGGRSPAAPMAPLERMDRDGGAPQRHVRGAPRRNRPAVGRRRGVRLRNELLGGGARRTDHAVPRDRTDLRRLGRRRRPRRARRVARRAFGGRPGQEDGVGARRTGAFRIEAAAAAHGGHLLRAYRRAAPGGGRARPVQGGHRGRRRRARGRRASGRRGRDDGGNRHPPAPHAAARRSRGARRRRLPQRTITRSSIASARGSARSPRPRRFACSRRRPSPGPR